LKAVVLKQPGIVPVLAYTDVPDPVIQPDELLIKVLSVGLCRHDFLVMNGTLRRGIPSDAILGHEVCGEVIGKGELIEDFTIGERIVTLLTQSCGICEQCQKGNDHRCDNGVGIGHGSQGGFAELLAVKQNSAIKIPDFISTDIAPLLTCPIGVGIQALTEVANISAGQSVAITGASGGLGIHVAQVAKSMGCTTFGITSSEGKISSLMELGLDEIVLASDDLDFSEILMAMTADQGVDVFIDCVGSKFFGSCIKSLTSHGKLILLGELGNSKAEVNLAEILFRDLTIKGSTGARRRHVLQAIALIENKQLKPVVHTKLPLKDMLIAYGWMQENKLFGRIVLSLT
jgi:acryloyl-coenzyme A reductase